MKYGLPRARPVLFLVVCAAVTLLTACSTPLTKHAGPTCVRKVDFSVAPDAKALAEHARQTGTQMYPAVCALLADGDCEFPAQFDICLKKQLRGMRSGEARVTQICLNAQYLPQFTEKPGVLDQALVHEMAHVAQHYYRPIIGRWVVTTPRPPFCWQEGIADYVCFKLGQTNGWRCAECDAAYPHYSNAYSCAGAFLMYLEGRYNANIVRQLNTVLRQGRYTDAFFRAATGKDLPALWGEFQHTPAYTPSAARMLELQQALGFVDGRLPKDIERRLKRYLDEHASAATRKMIKPAYFPGVAAKDIQTRLAIIGYFTQPGGAAETYMRSLQENYELPGFAKGQHGTLTGVLGLRDLNQVFPVERSFTATKRGERSTYHYTVARASAEGAWKLKRTWRANADGSVAEEYRIP
jgi:hypothetical protein